MKRLKQIACVVVIAVLLVSCFASLFIPKVSATTAFSDGFESGNFNAWTDTVSSPAINSTVAHNGQDSMQINCSINQYARIYGIFGEPTLDIRMFVYFSALPVINAWTGATAFLYARDNASNEIFRVGLEQRGSDNEWLITGNGSTNYVSPASAIKINTWYCIEVAYNITSGNLQFLVDDSLQLSIVHSGNNTIDGLYAGNINWGFTGNLLIDDFSASTSTFPTVVTASSIHTIGTSILTNSSTPMVFNGMDTQTLFGYEMYAINSTTLLVSVTPNDLDIIRLHGINLVRLDIQMNTALYGESYTNQTPTALNFNPYFWTILDALVIRAAQDGLWLDLSFAQSSSAMSGIGGSWGVGNGFPTWMYNGSWSYFNKIYVNNGTGISDSIRDFWNTNDTTAQNVRVAYQTFMKDIAQRYANNPNVILGMYNEPQNSAGSQDSIWGNSIPITQQQGADMYQTFMQNTINSIRTVAPNMVIFVNVPYIWDWTMADKINCSNIIVEAHSYDNITGNFFNLGLKYNQPFYLGEFGGIEQGGLDNRSTTIAMMQLANSFNVSWSYLNYNLGVSPSSQTWIDLQNSLSNKVVYYDGSVTVISSSPTNTPTPTQTGFILPTNNSGNFPILGNSDVIFYLIISIVAIVCIFYVAKKIRSR